MTLPLFTLHPVSILEYRNCTGTMGMGSPDGPCTCATTLAHLGLCCSPQYIVRPVGCIAPNIAYMVRSCIMFTVWTGFVGSARSQPTDDQPVNTNPFDAAAVIVTSVSHL